MRFFNVAGIQTKYCQGRTRRSSIMSWRSKAMKASTVAETLSIIHINNSWSICHNHLSNSVPHVWFI